MFWFCVSQSDSRKSYTQFWLSAALLIARYFSPVSYSFMMDCWKENPDERPSFQELVLRLEELMLEEVSMSIRLSGGGEERRGKESLTQQPGFEPSASLKYDALLLDKQPIRIISGCRPCQQTVMCVFMDSDSLRAGSLVWGICARQSWQRAKGAGERNGARKSEPARKPLNFEFRPCSTVKVSNI